MIVTLRRCATISSGKSLRSKGPPMSLEQVRDESRWTDLTDARLISILISSYSGRKS
jgi:hypothetical protein